MTTAAPRGSVRRFLYISPYFPPQTKVGALRPLKFARNLAEFGWQPVVLADLTRSDAVDAGLMELVPEETIVRFDYSAGAARNYQTFCARAELAGAPAPPPAAKPSRTKKRSSLARFVDARFNPEWVPLGEHSVDMPHATAAARRLLDEFPECEAVMANADPYAALLVGRRVADAAGVPFIGDLRDPWAPCDLRRPNRPALQKKAVDRMERWAIDGAARYILNTETTRDAYRAAFPHVPADRFAVIRNHGDRGIIFGGEHKPTPRFTVLFMGNFRRFVEGAQLVEALALLPDRGIDLDDIELVVTGKVPDEIHQLAERLGVSGSLRSAAFVPYREVGTYLETADLLVSLSHPSAQRIPAKMYDYAMTDRPVLVVADNPELARIAAQLGGATVVGRTDVDGIAAAYASAYAGGRRQTVDRRDAGLDSRTASRALAAILDDVCP